MTAKVRGAIIGVGETPYRTHLEKNYVELAQEAALAALGMAGLRPEDVDAVVFSMAPTGFVGITEAERWAVDAIGAVGKPFIRVHTGGATGGSAAQVGWMHVASGMYDIVLVVGADKVSETPDTQFILNLIWDPFYERGFGLNTITMAALQAVRRMELYGTTEREMAEVVVRSWRKAMRNPRAHLKGNLTIDEVLSSPYLSWPLRRYDCCPRSSGAAAIVIASERVVSELKAPAAWINGCGAVSNGVFLGDRMGPRSLTEYGEWEELRRAAQHAYAQAGIKDPRLEVDVAEIYAPFSIHEIMAVEALGFCDAGEGGRLIAEGYFDFGGEVVTNPSGGTLCSNPIGVTGLVRVCDAALQVMGLAGDYQVPGARVAVATAAGGSSQFQTCVVLGSEPL